MKYLSLFVVVFLLSASLSAQKKDTTNPLLNLTGCIDCVTPSSMHKVWSHWAWPWPKVYSTWNGKTTRRWVRALRGEEWKPGRNKNQTIDYGHISI